MKRLAAIVYSTGNERFTRVAYRHLRDTVDAKLTDIWVIDNGSEPPFSSQFGDHFYRYEKNTGGNAVHHRWMRDDWFGKNKPEFLAFLHCDLFIHEVGWDHRVVDAYDADPKLGLIGFVGSNEIDELGGRGGGTMLNFAGKEIADLGRGSVAEDHGRRVTGLHPAAVVDHCTMIFRRSLLERLTPQEGTYAPEHFFDRILCCQTIDLGYRVGVLGISIDHFSGGIAPGVIQANELREEWLTQEGIPWKPGYAHEAVYTESEKRFFRDYNGRVFPFQVDDDWNVHR